MSRVNGVEEVCDSRHIRGWAGKDRGVIGEAGARHWMGITSPEEPDDELLGWLPQSYQQMGLQERLGKG